MLSLFFLFCSILLNLRAGVVMKFKNKSEKGQGLVEYGLILALLALVTIATMSVAGERINGIVDPSKNAVGNAATSVQAN